MRILLLILGLFWICLGLILFSKKTLILSCDLIRHLLATHFIIVTLFIIKSDQFHRIILFISAIVNVIIMYDIRQLLNDMKKWLHDINLFKTKSSEYNIDDNSYIIFNTDKVVIENIIKDLYDKPLHESYNIKPISFKKVLIEPNKNDSLYKYNVNSLLNIYTEKFGLVTVSYITIGFIYIGLSFYIN